MPSSFSWLDYSEHDRRRTLEVIALFRERESRDELGIGTVRDAFADLLFPGTSTSTNRTAPPAANGPACRGDTPLHPPAIFTHRPTPALPG